MRRMSFVYQQPKKAARTPLLLNRNKNCMLVIRMLSIVCAFTLLLCSGSVHSAEVRSAKLAAQASTASEPQILLVSPRNYQVFQRSSLRRGQILISGKVLTPCTRLEARITGRSILGVLPERWIEVPFSSADMSFNSSLPISAGGWYHLEVRATIGIRVMARSSVDNVSVGEVFVGAGQSNSTNYGEEKLVPTSGKVSSFDGFEWKLAVILSPARTIRAPGELLARVWRCYVRKVACTDWGCGYGPRRHKR